MDLVEWARRHPRAADAALAVAVGGIDLAVAVPQQADIGGAVAATDWSQWGLIALAAVPVAFRRVRPIAALVVLSFVLAGLWGSNHASTGLGLMVLCYSAVVHGRRPWGMRVAVASAVVLSVWALMGVLAGQVPAYIVLVVAIELGGAAAFGYASATRQAYIHQIEQRAESAERERAAAEGRAMAQERTRIARELHDIVAHGLSVIVVQAGAGRRIIDRDPEGARHSLEQIEMAARTALGEMRQVLGVLRADEDVRRPQPGLASLDDLVQGYRDGGLDVAVEVDGAERTLPATLDVTAYRIVEEALTNVVRHAGPRSRARVRVDRRPDVVRVEVSDDGRGAAASVADPGFGLLGMRERVAVHGGTLRAGPSVGGGFSVLAELPVGGS